jgi:hypothetical protein
LDGPGSDRYFPYNEDVSASTIGLATYGAYWFILMFLIVFGFCATMLAFGRFRSIQPGSKLVAPAVFASVAPGVIGTTAAVEGHPVIGLILPVAAVLLALWWLSNMAKRE